MKKAFFLFLSFILLFQSSKAQFRLAPDSVLERQIVESGLIHSALPLDASRSFETNELKKKALASKKLEDCKLALKFPTHTDIRAKGPDDDPDYATYGSRRISFNAGGADWSAYNRLVFSIYPDCNGARVVNLNLSFGGASHLINLNNKTWNRCFFDIGDFDRKKVESVTFSCSIKGKDLTTGDTSVFYIENFELQLIENPEKYSGWNPKTGKIIYSTSGYLAEGVKTAFLSHNSANPKKFALIDAQTDKIAFEAQTGTTGTSIGKFDILNFSDFKTQGLYRLKIGNSFTEPFAISDNIWENSLWRTLNFIFCQRCGFHVVGKHGNCHEDLFAVHDGKRISYSGGWHDAGDLSQQTLQTGDITYTLFEAANKIKSKNPILAARLREEAEWGLDFILKTRFGDGYRASSMGLLIWQDGFIDTFDDITSVRVQNLAFDNFLYSAYLAYAAMSIDNDPAYKEYLQKTAEEDFAFAMKRFTEKGFDKFLFLYEHSYNTSNSQFMATISWAASMLYQLTGKEEYARYAADYIRYTIDCQRKEPVGKDRINGFFYRDKTRKAIVHYVHQSREQVYMQALTLLCETQPKHPDYAVWKQSIELYASFLKKIAPYTAPYGMLPSGVYNINESSDTESFTHLHLFPPDDAEERYFAQVKNGVKLDDEHYLKRFPVWFSIFNGNSAVHLSMGKAAAICGKFLNDETLLSVAREQLYWTVGKNPFGQSLIYGEGCNYPQMDSFSSGEITGEMPVGIRTIGDTDEPYFPQTNNACYKEVWVTTAGKWISLAVE
ncbi:MAG: glycoside hydrolase family 9 protein [Dysgonamonadaceae bacterium]|jgi:hypothetical protein|nr:glycoside hydrolase family 9 protein [Dysgonamonadaceae bacterium]